MVTNTLTPREQEVLELIRRGLTNEEIAQTLGISLDGAKYHVSQILSKLGVATRDEAAALPLPPERPRRHSWLVGSAGASITLAAAATIAVLAWGSVRSGSGDEAPDTDYQYHGRGPFIGEDHWHARYDVVIGVEFVDPFPRWESGVHTHGDSVIHLHPTTPDEEAANASLARFFSEAGGSLTEDEIRLPDGRSLRNGDPVPGDGRPGQVFIFLNQGEPVPPEYVPLDGDNILIGFIPPDSVNEFLATPAPEIAPGPTQTSLDELERNRELWASKGVNDYRFVANVVCHCASPGQVPLTVTVKDGAVTSLIYADGATIAPTDPDYEQILSAWTIDGLFDELESRLGDAFLVSAEYDPAYGFPTVIIIDNVQMAVDDEVTMEISGWDVIGD